MKYRSASEWVKAYDHIDRELTAKGFKPKLQTLNNKASSALKNFFTANNVEYQNAPSELLKNTFWQGSPQSIQLFHCTCGADFNHRWKSH
jgi:hypothetical protein